MFVNLYKKRVIKKNLSLWLWSLYNCQWGLLNKNYFWPHPLYFTRAQYCNIGQIQIMVVSATRGTCKAWRQLFDHLLHLVFPSHPVPVRWQEHPWVHGSNPGATISQNSLGNTQKKNRAKKRNDVHKCSFHFFFKFDLSYSTFLFRPFSTWKVKVNLCPQVFISFSLKVDLLSSAFLIHSFPNWKVKVKWCPRVFPFIPFQSWLAKFHFPCQLEIRLWNGINCWAVSHNIIIIYK